MFLAFDAFDFFQYLLLGTLYSCSADNVADFIRTNFFAIHFKRYVYHKPLLG